LRKPLFDTSQRRIHYLLDLSIPMANSKVVDVHTHMYPPSYIALLKSRETVPRIHSGPSGDRLIILSADDDDSLDPSVRGRPIGPEYSSLSHKISFMDAHHIDVSVISLANPWLDFLPASDSAEAAKRINDDMNKQCELHPGRLFAIGTLPLSGSIDEIVDEIRRLKTLKYMRGVIMGTSGLGQGLDDLKLEPVWAALQEQKQLVFIHPHYGLPNEIYGPRAGEYGHVLPLALGFPMETTIAVARMLVSGVWDRHQQLDVLLAHSGGTLPFLAGRIESCILHDGRLKKDGKLEGRRTVWDVLKKNVYLDAVVYGEAGLKAAIEVSGADRLMFG
jgi:aminocarboxymuconate-semialdehyde decarboxylase